MNIYIMQPLAEDDTFLSVKQCHFIEKNRESLRWHTQQGHLTMFVWFEDEDPPDLFMQMVNLKGKIDAKRIDGD